MIALNQPISKKIGPALAVAGFGFLLLTLTFLFDFLFHQLVTGLISLVTAGDPPMAWPWFPPLMHGLFVALISLISWPILRSRLGVLPKAIYLTVPVAVVLVTLGIFFYHWPLAVYTLGGGFTSGVLYYLYRTRQPWLYFYSVILVSLSLLIGTLAGLEI